MKKAALDYDDNGEANTKETPLVVTDEPVLCSCIPGKGVLPSAHRTSVVVPDEEVHPRETNQTRHFHLHSIKRGESSMRGVAGDRMTVQV